SAAHNRRWWAAKISILVPTGGRESMRDKRARQGLFTFPRTKPEARTLATVISIQSFGRRSRVRGGDRGCSACLQSNTGRKSAEYFLIQCDHSMKLQSPHGVSARLNRSRPFLLTISLQLR